MAQSSTREEAKVLIDATAIPADLGGVGRYVVALVAGLAKLGSPVSVVCQPRDIERFRQAGARRVSVAPPAARTSLGRFVWEQNGLPRLIRREGFAVVHSPHYTFPLLTRARRVVTIHDLTFFTHPELHSTVKRIFFGAWIRFARWRGASIVVPSEATKEEYVRVTGASATSVRVALHGGDPLVFREPSDQECAGFAERIGIGSAGWIAFLGTLEPRKNIPALISGYRTAMSTVPAAERPTLLLAGGPGWDLDVVPAVKRARRAGFDVRTLGYLPLEELPAFLGGALITTYPSLGEGFGLPVLEAMACGACVLTTSRPALPEVGGDAVAYTEVDPESIASALRELLSDAPRRAALRTAAVHRAAEFTWLRSARTHLAAYRGESNA